ncbi:MAG: DUF4437 domain-containing protein [Pseudomonadota bacterium]
MRTRTDLFGISAVCLFLVGCADAEVSPMTDEQRDSIQVITPDEVDYQPLNPARGDASPRAGVLWGDIRQNVASGVFLRFAAGFTSPPHIHNITYRAVVITGEVHNDDPEAARLWMGPGSFWIQPAGEDHITAAPPSSGATAFLEILEGPYLVQPSQDAFENSERPINLVPSNMVWMGPDAFGWIRPTPNQETQPEATLLWGSLEPGKPSATFVKLPPSYSGTLHTIDASLKAVTIAGDVLHEVLDVTESRALTPGGYFASADGVPHSLTCEAESHCLIYVRTDGQFRLE